MATCVLIITLLTVKTVLSEQNPNFTFPKDFKIGAATASYQIEGAWNVDGKGVSIWDKFTHDNPERISDRSNGDDAAKSYYKYKEDIKSVKDMGMDFYRFSISWPRIMPDGLPNNINKKGIDYYNDVINEVLKNDLFPLVTMFHWDLPQYLQDLGGWLNEEIVVYFEAYAKVLYECYGDRVKWWLTLNEPGSAVMGYETDMLAPGINASGIGYYLAAHNMLKAHARAFRLYQRKYRDKQNGKISFSTPVQWATPLNQNSSDDIDAAELFMEFNVALFDDPVYSQTGDYPQKVKDRVGNFSMKQGFPKSRLPSFTKEEVEYVKGSADYYALNEYSTMLIKKADGGEDTPSMLTDAGIEVYIPTQWPQSKGSTWETIAPKSIRQIINWITHRYGKKWDIFITENGYSDKGKLQDKCRIDYLATYMVEVLKAMYIDDCPVIGYTVWSLIDNYEWADGYTSKFGLYHVDFNDEDRKRTPKQSSYFMANVTKTKRIPQEYAKLEKSLAEMETSPAYRRKATSMKDLRKVPTYNN
ncbi:myrosinase 1-like [Periplaneta americana]|uniref:myrosinase 1-like n=1 Tax=Periplaneta americana TaxID=6978 RepID=UPI0037E73000